MGAEVIKAILGSDCRLAGAIDNTPGKEGVDVGLALGHIEELEVALSGRLRRLSLRRESISAGPWRAVLVDFTHPSVVYEHTRAAIAYGVHL